MDRLWNEFIKSGSIRCYLKYKQAIEESTCQYDEGREYSHGSGKGFGTCNKDL